MATIDVSVVTSGIRCHTEIIPPYSEVHQRYEYPLGTCPYYRQMPRGDGRICVLFQPHTRGEVPLSVDSEGFALRIPACLSAEARSGKERTLRIDLPATATSCENQPIIDGGTGKDAVDALKKDPHTTCPLYREYPGGSSLCTLGNRVGIGEPRRVLYLKRKDDGFTPRIRDCLESEAPEDSKT